jgi:hypothetical protein
VISNKPVLLKSGLSVFKGIYLLVEIFQGKSDPTNGEQEEGPVDDAFEVVEARAPREEGVARLVEPGQGDQRPILNFAPRGKL